MALNLIEALVGSTIFLTGVLAAAPLIVESVAASRRADDLLQATLLARKHLDDLRSEVRRGDSPVSSEIEERGFLIMRSVDSSDPDFYLLNVTALTRRDLQKRVELIALMERP